MVTSLWVHDIQVVLVPFWHIFCKPINTQFSPHAHSLAFLCFHQLSECTAHDNEKRKIHGVKDPPCSHEDEAHFSRLFIKHNKAREGTCLEPGSAFWHPQQSASRCVSGQYDMLITWDCPRCRATLSGFDAATDKMQSMRRVHCKQLKICTRVKVKIAQRQ